MKEITTTVVVCTLLLAICQTRMIQITNKNLPNVLKSQPILLLYHHPDCQYSMAFKQQYTHAYQATHSQSSQMVGIVDCSLEQNLCRNHNITEYPAMRKVRQDMTLEVFNADVEMGRLDEMYKEKDQYKSMVISNLLKQEPNFVVVMFEEEGMPVPDNQKPKGMKYSHRIFYMSEGRLAKTFAGFVNYKMGCWLFHLTDPQTGDIAKHYCGDTYQSQTSLSTYLTNFLQKYSKLQLPQPSLQQLSLLDSSDHENQTILGYKELIYWLKNYELQLQISTHSKISMCSFVYLWTPACEQCNYETDMKVIKRAVEKGYRDRDGVGGEVSFKSKLYSYDVGGNRIVFGENQLRKIVGLPAKSNGDDQFYIVPNLIAICFSTSNNRDLQKTLSFSVYKLQKIIASQNLEQFTNSVINSEQKLATAEKSGTKEPYDNQL